MRLDPQSGRTLKITVQAKDRTAADKTLALVDTIAEHETRDEASDLAASIAQDLTALLTFFPDTRKPKKLDEPTPPAE